MYKDGSFVIGDLPQNINDLDQRVDNNKASLIIINGGVGEGKTTLLVHTLDMINKFHNLPQIDLVEAPQLAMGGSDFLKKLRICYDQKLPCLGYDEAGDFSKRGSLTQFNSMINRTFETFRAFKCVVVICLPNFDILDQNIFDNKIPRLMINVKGRTKTQGNYYGYSLYRTMLLKSYMKKMNIKNYAYSLVQPNFWGHFHDLTPERSLLLDKLSTKNKLDILKKAEVRIDGLLTYAELATKLFKSLVWVRTSITNLKLKPVRIINKYKYFDTNTLNILSEHLDYVSENPKKKPKL